MGTRIHRMAVAIGLALVAAPSLGQDSAGRRPQQTGARTKSAPGEAQQARPGDWQRSMNARFLEQEPRVGQKVPEVALYDADGNPAQLGDVLRGHYSVLVFGCLT